MTTQISVINFALSGLLGVNPITSIDEDSSSALAVRLSYDITLRALLEIHDWNFATRRKVLTVPNVIPPAWGYSHSFNLPADCLRVIRVGEFGSIETYKVQNREVLSDSTEILIIYVSDDVNLQHASSLFIETFAAKLAVNICGRVSGLSSKLKNMASLYATNLSIALQADKEETSYVQDRNIWLEAQRGGW